jgi:[acyl-carrier-protein] S-malonyltransferase
MLVVIFPGQGSQRAGMGVPWRDHPSWQLVGELSAVVGRDIAELLLDADGDALRATRNAQLATYALSLIALDAARKGPLHSLGAERPPAPGGAAGGIVAVAGHSLGEYTALVAAGALDAGTGARLVQARGEAMQVAAEANPGTMAAVLGLDLAGVTEACAGTSGAWVANDNTPGQVVVAGTLPGVEEAGAGALRHGAKRVVPLKVGGAFHTPLMKPAQQPLDAALAAVDFAPASCPVVANVDAAAHTDGFGPLLSAQLCSRVRWRESLLAMADMGATLFLELGPGTELSGMVKRTVPDATRANVSTPDDLETLGNLLAG